jgi:putative tryptophan/tyrosine transport system substrate-binding protein
MKRRDFITLLGGAAAAWPAAVHAQHAGMPIVGVLGSGSPAVYAESLTLIRQGLGALGFAESRTVIIDDVFRWCLDNGLRLVKQQTMMTMGLYNEPVGAYLPSILY